MAVEPAQPGSIGPAWTVSALLLAVSDLLASRFASVTVRGELSGFTRAASGHCYFSLKDADGAAALVRCAMFRRAAALLDFAPADGQKVVLRGRIAVYEPRGEFQLVVESLQREGLGSLYEQFLRLKARLEAQGLFDPARRRPVPAWPRRVGVVTSRDAAALRDVLTALARRAPQVQVVIYPSLVQGAEAPASLVAALGLAAERREVDTLLLVRGGGSLEDLWAFNDERVVRAVAASPIPVVCGVGHETDITLCDLAADLRAPTPTAAAELAAPPQAEAREALDREAGRLQRAVQRHLEQLALRLDRLAQRAGRPAASLQAQRQRLQAIGHRLPAALARRAEAAAWPLPGLARRLGAAARHGHQQRLDRLDHLAARLQAAHPQHVLQRGYAWIQDEQGQPVLRAASLATGDRVLAHLADGRITASVQAVALGPLTEGAPGDV